MFEARLPTLKMTVSDYTKQTIGLADPYSEWSEGVLGYTPEVRWRENTPIKGFGYHVLMFREEADSELFYLAFPQ